MLSGVNRGHNTAEDVTMSGTVAGAIQGMALGVPAIALSQALAVFHDDVVAHFETAEAYAPGIIERLLEAGWPKDVIINLNFPNRPPDEVEAVEVTRQGFRDIHNMKAERRTDLRGRDYYWMGFTARRPAVDEGTDLAAVLAGPHLRHPSAHRFDPHADRSRPKRRAWRRAAEAAGERMTEPARQAETHETQLARLVLALRSQGVTDPAVLAAIERTPRDLFTPELFKERSWEDSALPIACGQTISQPFIVGLMTQALTLEPRDRVLEIGTGFRLPDQPCSRAWRASSTPSSATGR